MTPLSIAIVVLYIPASLDANRLGSTVDAEVLELDSSGRSKRSGGNQGNAVTHNNSQSNASMFPGGIGSGHDIQDGSFQAQVKWIQGSEDDSLQAKFNQVYERGTDVTATLEYGPSWASTKLKLSWPQSALWGGGETFKVIVLDSVRDFAFKPFHGSTRYIIDCKERKWVFEEEGIEGLDRALNNLKRQENERLFGQLPTVIPDFIKGPINDLVIAMDARSRAAGHFFVNFWDFDDTCFPTHEWGDRHGGKLEVKPQQLQVPADPETLRTMNEMAGALIAQQPGISIIVSNGHPRWLTFIIELMGRMETSQSPENSLAELVKRNQVVVISTYRNIDSKYWDLLHYNKINVFALVLGAFAQQGLTFEGVYSYGDGALDMVAGNDLASRYRLQSWIGVRFIPGPTQKELIGELHWLLQNPLPKSHIQFKIQNQNQVVALDVPDKEICEGWEREKANLQRSYGVKLRYLNALDMHD